MAKRVSEIRFQRTRRRVGSFIRSTALNRLLTLRSQRGPGAACRVCGEFCRAVSFAFLKVRRVERLVTPP
jgi:hypothetical protein